MSLYHRKEWKEFRDNVIETDGYKCTRCGRGKDEVVLQVHHERYLKGKLPWEYGTKGCVTLCKGCHAVEHGIIQPKTGWDYISHEDLEDLAGICQNCGTSIRYIYLIAHEKWSFMEVGTNCCDNLTATKIASSKQETEKRYKSRKKRFLKSKRWKLENDIHKIKQSLFHIKIHKKEEAFYLQICHLKSQKKYETLEAVKSTAFDVIESGTLRKYCDKKGEECKCNEQE